jgi:hypothetical protein
MLSGFQNKVKEINIKGSPPHNLFKRYCKHKNDVWCLVMG